MLPPERGIPEFRRISIRNVTVKDGQRTAAQGAPSSSVMMHTPDVLNSLAFDIEAHPEKPMRRLTWENVTIEAGSAGAIAHARDWTMNNVTVRTPDGAPVRMENCENVPMPRMEKASPAGSRAPAT